MESKAKSDRPATRRRLGLAIALAGLMAGSSAEAVVLPAHYACQAAVSKAGRTYLEAVLKVRTRCRSSELAGAPDACTTALVQKSLADAASKHDAKLARPCGTLPEDALVSPRPSGLALVPYGSLGSRLRASYDRIAVALVADLYEAGSGQGTAPGTAARSCQAALDGAVVAQVSAAFSEIGSRCQDLEDKGKTAVDETSRITEACLSAATGRLAAAATKGISRLRLRCTAAALTELRACGRSPKTVESTADCVLPRANQAAAAALMTAHGRTGPRIRGRIETSDPATGGLVPVPDAIVRLRDADGAVVDEARSRADGSVDLTGRPLEDFRVCWERPKAVRCAEEAVTVGIDPVFFGSRKLDLPLATGETAWIGRVLRSDGSPCFDGSSDPDFALRGGVAPRSKSGLGERFGVSPGGDFVAIGSSTTTSLVADCGEESITFVPDGAGLSPAPGLVLAGTNSFPKAGGIAVLDSKGAPVTDPDTLSAGDLVFLEAGFSDPEDDPLEFRWEVASGPGSFESGDGKPLEGNPRRASGGRVGLRLGPSAVGDRSDEISVRVVASDRKGGIESLALPIGPIFPGPGATPCPLIPKLEKVLCGSGYTTAVPEPAGGRKNFLSYEYRNPVFNSPPDACAYYNLVDPQCIDLDCDGVPDPGTDPSGLCKRTTLGGWWQKNGFDPATGLGPDVVTAWYLNSNDLGFGREMHCRVTGWRSNILDRPAGALLASEVLLSSLRSDILATASVSDWKFLLPKFPATIACYVVNYTTDACFNYPTNLQQNADLAYQGQQSIQSNPALDPLNAYGTVAMEFAPVEGFGDLGPITKFFVYDGRIASGKRLAAANLDGCGAKSVPEVCMSCHGGHWPGDGSQGTDLDAMIAGLSQPAGVLANIDASDTVATDAGYQLRRAILSKLTKNEPGFSTFLPFDPETYVFPAAATQASQANSIRRLNQLVLWAKPTTAVSDLVRGWYGNDFTSGVFAPWRPATWNDDPATTGDESSLYDDVYAVSCRGCHAAHYSMDQPTWFPGSSRVCVNGLGEAGSSPTMPHAKLTYLNLWKSDFPQGAALPALESWYTAMEGGFTSCD